MHGSPWLETEKKKKKNEVDANKTTFQPAVDYLKAVGNIFK